MAKGRVHISEGVDTKVLRSAMHALNESCHADVLKFLGRVCVLSVQILLLPTLMQKHVERRQRDAPLQKPLLCCPQANTLASESRNALVPL